jgi:hypothetical protein
MLSAGFLGGPGIGFKQDKYASERLQELSQETYTRYSADSPNQFLFFTTQGLNGAKVSTLTDDGKTLASEMEILSEANESDANLEALNTWWQDAKETASADKEPVSEATLYGSRMALKLTAIVPAVMAICYLLLIVYFKSIGGYKALTIDGEEASGGVEGPVR